MNLLISADPNLGVRSDSIKRAGKKKSLIDPSTPKICSSSFPFLLYRREPAERIRVTARDDADALISTVRMCVR